MKKTIKFHEAKEVNEGRDAEQIRIFYSIIDSSLIGKPEEESSTKYYQIMVGISRTILTMWSARDSKLNKLGNVVKILYEFGKRHIIEKIKENTLMESEEFWIHTASHPKACPFNPDKISDTLDEVLEVEAGKEELMQDLNLLQLATSIIEFRDYINEKFIETYDDVLFKISAERDLLNLFKDAYSTEEFIFRLNAIKNLVTNLNVNLLRKITGITDKQVKSISLLESFLKSQKNYDSSIIEVFRNINRMRQGYPIHGDNVDGVQESFKYFNLEYPILQFSESWKTLMTYYRNSLKQIFDILSK